MPPLLGQPFLPPNEARLRAVVVTPAAGADWVIAVPDGYYWDPLTLDAKLVTSAVVINRTVVLSFDDGANQMWIDFGPAQAANATVDYLVGEGIPRDVTTPSVIKLSNPGDLRMQAGWRVKAVTTNLQVGDLWVVTLTVREYQINAPTGPRSPRRANGWRISHTSRPGRAY